MTLDHKEAAIHHFLDSGFSTSEDDVVTVIHEGVQSSTGDLVKKRSSNLAEVLHNSLSYLSSPSSEVAGVEAAPKDKEQLRKAANKERSSLSVVLLLSARRRELLSELHLRSERAAQSALTQNKLKLAQEKEKQEREEAKRREAERREREREENRELEKRKYAKGLVESGVVKGDVEVKPQTSVDFDLDILTATGHDGHKFLTVTPTSVPRKRKIFIPFQTSLDRQKDRTHRTCLLYR